MEQRAKEIWSHAFDSERLKKIAFQLERATAQQIIAWAFDEFGEGLAIATGFGVEGMALLDMAVKIHRSPFVFFLDTGFLFPETYELRRRLEERYGIEIHAFQTSVTHETQERSYGPQLWKRDPDLCCRLRKLDPLERALDGRSAWMTAIRRDQTTARALARPVECDEGRGLAKVNPLVRWSKREVWHYVGKHNVPYNPLHDRGFPSIGCTHCTEPVAAGEGDRAGRWPGSEKTECGLHVATSVSPAREKDSVHGEPEGASGP